MKTVIIYGGQGNVQSKHLCQLVKTPKGEILFSKLQATDLESYQLMMDVINHKVSLDNVHASMLANFLYNDWLTNDEKIVSGIGFSAHSAGIFNVLYASGSTSFENIIHFIKRRAQLIENCHVSEELWLLMVENIDMFSKDVLKEQSEKVKLAIITDDRAGVIAMDQVNRSFFDYVMTNKGYFYKLKQLGVKAPYHTDFLNESKEQYKQLIESLDISQNDDYDYIFHCDQLVDEILYQWTNLFNWRAIKETIIEKDAEIIDISPNRFISSQLQKMKKRGRKQL
ncbi:TPA: CylD [Streptococcus agalactiae]